MNKYTIGDMIRSARIGKGLSQLELADRLGKYGISVRNAAVAKWEKGENSLNAETFLALCIELGIEDILSEATDGEIGFSCGLNREGREKLSEYRKLLLASGMYCDAPVRSVSLRSLPLYDIAVSAGTGQFLDGENYELVEAGDDVPPEANYAVRISGDSMEPEYHDGEIVWVKQQGHLIPGQIGIFFYDGNAFIKQLIPGKRGRTKLHSLNPAYPDIEVSPEYPLQVLGKVLT